MKQLAVPFQQLVERRLWPLALLLVAAAAAVPFLLAKDAPRPAPAATAPAAPTKQGDTTPIVALADDARIDTERHVLGAPKDPFRPAVKARAARTPAPQRTEHHAGPSSTPEGSTLVGGGMTTPGTTGGTPLVSEPTPAATPTAPPKPTYPLYSLVARFGPAIGPKTHRLVLRSTGLPSNAQIGLIYKGVLKDHKTAVFWVVSGTQVDGDGKCVPGPQNCQYVQLKPGETLFFKMPDGSQYELDLLSVHAGKASADAAKAQSARALPKQVRAGSRRFRYDWRSGVLDAVSTRELKAAAASASAGVPVG